MRAKRQAADYQNCKTAVLRNRVSHTRRHPGVRTQAQAKDSAGTATDNETHDTEQDPPPPFLSTSTRTHRQTERKGSIIFTPPASQTKTANYHSTPFGSIVGIHVIRGINNSQHMPDILRHTQPFAQLENRPQAAQKLSSSCAQRAKGGVVRTVWGWFRTNVYSTL